MRKARRWVHRYRVLSPLTDPRRWQIYEQKAAEEKKKYEAEKAKYEAKGGASKDDDDE